MHEVLSYHTPKPAWQVRTFGKLLLDYQPDKNFTDINDERPEQLGPPATDKKLDKDTVRYTVITRQVLLGVKDDSKSILGEGSKKPAVIAINGQFNTTDIGKDIKHRVLHRARSRCTSYTGMSNKNKIGGLTLKHIIGYLTYFDKC